MQANQKLSLKDKITAHLPGHKNQDNNMNGVPDKLEKNTAANTGHRTLSDMNGNGVPDRLERGNSFGTTAPLTATSLGNGASMIPGSSVTTTTTTVTKDVNGRPLQGNILKDKVITSTTSVTEPAMIQTNALPVATDLNRNGIPDQLEGQGFGFVGSVSAVQSSFVDVREAPVIVEKIEKPTIVHEVYKTEEVVQIQPVIEREREQLDVYEVVQPMREREVIATEVRQAMLPAQTRAVVVEDNSAYLAARSAPTDFSTREVVATRSQVVENAPIIHETIHHRVIEEVQPVIYKEIDRPILIKETLPIYEKIVEAPHSHHTVLPMRDLGVRTVTTTTSTGFTDLNRDGIPDQLQGGMYQTTGLQSGLTSQGTFLPQTGLQQGFARQGDLNGNGIPDAFERQGSYGQTGFARPGDLNGNGVPDVLERQGSYGQTGFGQTGFARQGDLNGNGIPDAFERQGSYGQTGFARPGDLNGNGIPDAMERQGSYGNSYGATGLQGGLNDRNMNGIPDNLEGGRAHRSLNDLNGNGIPDRMEKAHGLKDLNGNGVDDSLERRMGATSLTNTRV